jgi:hypothetical protein
MNIFAVVFEQLEINGELRSFTMEVNDAPIYVSFLQNYDDERSGPVHFLDKKFERQFRRGLAECKTLHLAVENYRKVEGRFQFSTRWKGIRTERSRLSYYALSLPTNAVPVIVKTSDPLTGKVFSKAVVRDDQRQRYVVYLGCRSAHGSFDFDLRTEFRECTDSEFSQSSYSDEAVTEFGENIYEFMRSLSREDRRRVGDDFFGGMDNPYL